MSFWLHVELDCDEEQLPDFTNWCSRPMMYALAHEHELFDGDPSILDLVAKRLNVDVSPLHKVSGGDMDLFFEEVDPNDKAAWAEAERQRADYERKHEANWQSPSVVGECIRALTQVLDSHPDVFKELDVSQYLDGDYYTSGEFRTDLDHLYRIIAWAESTGVRRLRLLIV